MKDACRKSMFLPKEGLSVEREPFCIWTERLFDHVSAERPFRLTTGMCATTSLKSRPHKKQSHCDNNETDRASERIRGAAAAAVASFSHQHLFTFTRNEKFMSRPAVLGFLVPPTFSLRKKTNLVRDRLGRYLIIGLPDDQTLS